MHPRHELEARAVSFQGGFVEVVIALQLFWKVFMRSRFPNYGGVLVKSLSLLAGEQERAGNFYQTAQCQKVAGDPP